MDIVISADNLVDRIYEAAFLPEMWPSVLQGLAEISRSAGGSICLIDESSTMKFLASDMIRPALLEIDRNNEWQKADIIGMMFAMPPPPGFIYDRDYFPDAAVDQNLVRTSRMGPLGIGGQVGSFVMMPTREIVLFTVERWLTNDRPGVADLQALNNLRPHLCRAGLVAARLRLERARATTSTLESLGLPAAVLSANGKVVASNALLDDMQRIFRPAAFGRLSLSDRAADAMLGEALKGERRGVTMPVRSIPVRPNDGEPPYVVHLVPVRRSAHDVFSYGDMVLAATRVDASAGRFPSSTLIGLFDLSPAEAKLAVHLAEGDTIAQAAVRSGITVKSARTYLDRLFMKTGTRRQVDLISLIRSTAVIGVDRPRNHSGLKQHAPEGED